MFQKSEIRTTHHVCFFFGTLRDAFHSFIVNTSAQMSDTLQRSAVRNAESIFFWTGFRRLLGALEEVCPGEK